MSEKTCIKCGELKALEMFHRHKLMGDGHLNSCRRCIAAYNKQRSQANPEISKKKYESERKRLGITRTHKEFLLELKANAAGKKATALKYYRANKERQASWAKADRAANPEKYKARSAAYRAKVLAESPDEFRAQKTKLENKRRAAKLQRIPAWADHDAIAGMYELCALFRRIGVDLTVDHIVPLQGKSVCGFHSHDNLQLMHKSLNSAKHNKLLDELTGY